MLRTDARLGFPAYTGMETRIVEDIRHVSADRRDRTLTLMCRLNKDVASADFDRRERRNRFPWSLPDDDSRIYTASWTLADSHRYKVHLVDRDGLKNKVVSEIAVNVARNKPPTILVTRPGHDSRVSPVEELPVKADIADDFGVVRHGLQL